MKFHFTKHAKQKFIKTKEAGFYITQKRVKSTVSPPVKIEEKPDGTFIASSIFDEKHILRVVYRHEGDIIIIITFYPGRRKVYEI